MDHKSESIACSLCSENATLIYKDYPGYQIPSVFDIYFCTSCNTSFSVPRIESNDIYDLIYKNGASVRWYDRYWRNAEIVKTEKYPLNYLAESEDTYWAVKESLSRISKNSNSSPLILEIGCGLGYLTYSLNKAGYNSVGLDISHEAVNQAIKNYGSNYICADLHQYAETHENEYDVIIFTELIEHLNDIFGFMQSLKKILKPDGRIILTTPNKSFYPQEVIWATDLPPVHCWWLSEESVQYIAKVLKMKVSFLDFKKYYSRHTTWVDKNKISIPITPPVFDSEGNLIDNNPSVFIEEGRFRKILKKIDFLKLLHSHLRYLLVRNKKNILIAAKKGPVLCAILQKL